MKRTDDILRFEQESNLFDITNGQGLRVWEAIRYCVNTQILRYNRPPIEISNKSNNSTLSFSIKRVWKFLVYSISHYRCKNLFVIYSRSISHNRYVDIIMDDLYGISDRKDSFVIETSFNWDRSNYKYGKVSPSLTTLVMRLLKPKYDFSDITTLIRRGFPEVELDIDEVNFYYSLFVSQYKFYNLFFKLFHFKRVFFVQNGICKGLIAAAKNNNITIAELQHGQISRNHFAYSYPLTNITSKDSLYNPDYLLTFGSLWLNDAVFPGVNVTPLGNNYYCYKDTNDLPKKKNVLVVSSSIHQEKLKELVKEISLIDPTFHFFYKLHPDEYKSFNEYIDYFSDLPNVEVVKNEFSISEIIAKTELSLVVQSTVMVETLNAGRRVFVYRVLDYEVMDFVYGQPGISFVDNAKSFFDEYSRIGNLNLPKGRYFMPFDKETGKRMLSI